MASTSANMKKGEEIGDVLSDAQEILLDLLSHANIQFDLSWKEINFELVLVEKTEEKDDEDAEESAEGKISSFIASIFDQKAGLILFDLIFNLNLSSNLISHLLQKRNRNGKFA